MSDTTKNVNGLSGQKRELLERLLREEGLQAPKEEKIERGVLRAVAPLSFAQERLWMFNELEPGSPVYNVPIAVRLEGPLDAGFLEQAIGEIIRRHEILRTSFEIADGQPVQRITPGSRFTLSIAQLDEMPEPERDAKALEAAQEEAVVPFDLSRAPLLRANLLRLGEARHILLLTVHHIICDGWSIGVLVSELAALYEAFSHGRPSPLSELPIQYADYAQWQRQWLDGEKLEPQLSYWRGKLAGTLPVLEWPFAKRPTVQSHDGAKHRLSLPHDLREALSELSRKEGVTLFMTLLAAFKTLLYRNTGEGNLLVGSPVAGRRPETEALIGYFANTLVLRTEVSGKLTFRELLGSVRETAVEAYAHQDVPFERLVEELQPERSLSHAPLFQVMFVLQNVSLPARELSGVSMSRLDIDNGTAKFDLLLELFEDSGELSGWLEYDTELFDEATVAGVAEQYLRLLRAVVDNPGGRISGFLLLGETQQKEALLAGRGTSIASEPATLHGMFEARAALAPDLVAIEAGSARLTYAELEGRAGRVARKLRSLGVGPEVAVAIYAERSAELIEGLLGALKAGGAFVPIDPRYPRERVRLILEDTAAPVVLTQRAFVSSLPASATTVLCLDDDGEWSTEGEAGSDLPALPDNTAYIIYTSGTTGRPKGVMVSHRAICNHLRWRQRLYPLTDQDKFLHKASPSFDISVWEIFAPLLAGARLLICPPRGEQDSAYLADLIARERVSVAHFNPSTLRAFLEEPAAATCSHLKHVFCGGEVLRPAGESLFLSTLQAELHNQYGPTETTVDVLCWDCERDGTRRVVPIGHPIDNTSVYILDAHLQSVAVGVVGELCVGGEALARGYLHRPELTAAKFIPDPFSDEPGSRLYRTGDLARYGAGGAVEFVGRRDRQVKVRGFRIELEEVEAVLGTHPFVSEAAVVARESADGDKRLVAYFKSDKAQSAAELRRYLKEQMPDYMVPSAFVALDALPRTPSGKLDRSALPEDPPESDAVDDARERTPVEETVAAVWARLLGVERVRLRDNFFELGGHSLLATRLVSQLREVFKIELPLRNVFEAPTLIGLAGKVEAAIRAGEGSELPSVKPFPRDAELPLSFAQERLWLLHQLESTTGAYNVSTALRLKGRLNTQALERAINEVVRRHEVLRTHYVTTQGRPVQVIETARQLELPASDLSHVPETEREARVRGLAAEFNNVPFDLSVGPLLRMRLLRLREDEHVLLLTMHHIVSDGWSVRVLVREVKKLYAGLVAGEKTSLPELPVQYVDFAMWQRENLQGAALDRQAAYWKAQLGNAPTGIDLPTDRPRPAKQSYRGARQTFALRGELVAKLREISNAQGATLFMTLLAAWQTLLYRYSRQTDIVVGAPIANRSRAEIEDLIGFFVNTLALRTRLSPQANFKELLQQVRGVTLDAYAHQDVPFERLVQELQPERSLSHAPLFQVMFVLQNAPRETLELPGLEASRVDVDNTTAKFDLTIELSENGEGMDGEFEYSTDLFDASTISRMAAHFQILLEGVAADPNVRLSALPLLSDDEKRPLLAAHGGEQEDLRCIHELFAAQATRTPDSVAVIFGRERVTYAELNRRANAVARELRRLGVGPEVLVGIFTERSVGMVVALIAVLKAGGAYVPLDSNYPPERLGFMLEDAGLAVLITENCLRDRLPFHTAPLVLLDDIESFRGQTDDNPTGAATLDNLAYVIYTSGSTGRPKGVAIAHRSAAELLSWSRRYFTEERLSGVLASTSVCFDLSIFELFAPLSCGGKIVLAENALALPSLPAASEVTLVNTVPSAMAELVKMGGLPRSVLTVNLAGEPLKSSLVKQIYEATHVEQVFNLYGPSEDTTYTTAAAVARQAAHEPTIGLPLPGTEICLLDENMQPVPRGVAGELYTGGVGLARGYLNRPELTAERFIPYAFSREPGARLYRTGDMARVLASGELEFLGRVDYQVKLRGFRIELGEIEAVLSQNVGVREVAVVARDDGKGGARLVAYVSGAGDAARPAELREYLKKKLPDYMIPATFVMLDKLPLTPNGKLDRSALPEPEARSAADSTEPRTEVEAELAGMWTRLLGVARVGINDNFFEMGGHSLLAMQVLAEVRGEFGLDLPLRQLFENPTVAMMAGLIEQAQIDQAGGDMLEQILAELDQLTEEDARGVGNVHRGGLE